MFLGLIGNKLIIFGVCMFIVSFIFKIIELNNRR